MTKDAIEWPEDPAEGHESRRDRMACLMALKHKDLDYVNKMLSEDLDKRSVFNLFTIIAATHPAKVHLDKWQFAFDTLMTRLQTEDYSEALIESLKTTLA